MTPLVTFYRSLPAAAIVLSKVQQTCQRQLNFNLLSTIAANEEHAQVADQDKFTKEFLTNRIPATQFQKILLTAGASLASLIDPHR